jgi:hypothetical protein
VNPPKFRAASYRAQTARPGCPRTRRSGAPHTLVSPIASRHGSFCDVLCDVTTLIRPRLLAYAGVADNIGHGHLNLVNTGLNSFLADSCY